MKFRIPTAYRPLVVALIVVGLAYGVYIAVTVFGEPAVTDCCAAEA